MSWDGKGMIPEEYRESVLGRLAVRTVIRGECWLWTGAKDLRGYGRLGVGKHAVILTHRASFMLHVGPIPEGSGICHHCDTPGCWRPSHLFAGDQGANARDMVAKGRHNPNGNRTKTSCKRGHSLIADNIYLNKKGGRVCRACENARHRAARQQRIA